MNDASCEPRNCNCIGRSDDGGHKFVTRPNLLFSGSTDSVSCTHVSMDPVPSLKLAEHESPHHRKLAHPLILLSCEKPLHGEEQFSPFNNAGLLEAFL
jgi:hypothetical protein